jgi:group I intron endonuclease
MSGIYQIYNPINNKRYIGSSINVERRLKEHLRNLEKNRHCNDHLQSAYNKYKDVLQFQFLEECEPDECLIFEQYYLDYYKSYIREFGYNIDPEAKYAGKHLSEETKEKLDRKPYVEKYPKKPLKKLD